MEGESIRDFDQFVLCNVPGLSVHSSFQPFITMIVIGVNTTKHEIGVLLSFGVSEPSNFISVFIIWKAMIKEMFFSLAHHFTT